MKSAMRKHARVSKRGHKGKKGKMPAGLAAYMAKKHAGAAA